MFENAYVTHSLKKSTDLKYIQELVQYENSKTTEIYTQWSMEEIGKIKNPLDNYYKAKSSTIHANKESIVKQNKDITEINTL